MYTCQVTAQNLVPNSGFEDTALSDKGLTTLIHARHWELFNSPDYYNESVNAQGILPETRRPKANSGNGCVGLGLYGNLANKDYREYLYARLLAPLKKDSSYYLSLFVIYVSGRYAIDGFGAWFTDSILKDVSVDFYFNASPQLENPKGNILYDKRNEWILFNGLFRAKGSEQYIVIGNFRPDSITKKVKILKKGLPGAYYAIDEVSVVPMSYQTTILVDSHYTFPADTIRVRTSYILHDLHFKTDAFMPAAESLPELDKWVLYLKTHISCDIQIFGHTDNTGSDEYNFRLSAYRAKSVVDYLIRNGIQKDRVSFYGYGSTMPAADNLTEDGKRLNRRVEIVIIPH